MASCSPLSRKSANIHSSWLSFSNTPHRSTGTVRCGQDHHLICWVCCRLMVVHFVSKKNLLLMHHFVPDALCCDAAVAGVGFILLDRWSSMHELKQMLFCSVLTAFCECFRWKHFIKESQLYWKCMWRCCNSQASQIIFHINTWQGGSLAWMLYINRLQIK